MRNIYPKLITTLFLILFVALVLKYADADNKNSDARTTTARIGKLVSQGN